jgi:hypothetical protein
MVDALPVRDADQLLNLLDANGETSPETLRRSAIRSLKGVCSGSKPNLEDFMREKQEELNREGQRPESV